MSKPSYALVVLLCKLIDGNAAVALPKASRGRPYIQGSGTGEVVNRSTVEAAIRQGYLERQDRANWTLSSYVVTEAGRTVAEANRTMLKGEARRLVVTVPVVRQGETNPLEVGILCEVLRETPTKVIVRILRNPTGATAGVVSRVGNDAAVSLHNVKHRDITEQQYDRMVLRAEAHRDARAAVIEARAEALRKAAEPFRVMTDRLAADFNADMAHILGQ